jgi:uncharacterized protein YbjT (DUF2867 family)
MTDRLITVFGGSGFLGRRIVRHLRECAFSVRPASRHPDRTRTLFDTESIEPIAADVHDSHSVAQACAGAYGVVNAVSLYVEQGEETFRSVHVEAAERVAAAARRAGAQRFVHISGIGADPASQSPYIRSRGEGETVVRSAYPGAIVVRPAVMFGPDDKFLTTILDLLRRLPVYPMFGRGNTKLQPAFVDDVAQAVARCLERPQSHATTFECAGPRVYSYAELLETIAAAAGLRRMLLPIPFSIWHILAFGAEALPNPPITRNQVELMEIDNVSSSGVPGFQDLGISPQSIVPTIQELLRPTHDRARPGANSKVGRLERS